MLPKCRQNDILEVGHATKIPSDQGFESQEIGLNTAIPLRLFLVFFANNLLPIQIRFIKNVV